MGYFGTDGIRRRSVFFKKEFLSLFARGVSQLPNCRKVAIARDTRKSGEQISAILAQELAIIGINVILIGIVPSPCLAYCIANLGCDYGIMVTASHNPPEYNGLKIFSSNGSKINKNCEAKIESYLSRPFFVAEGRGEIYEADGFDIYKNNLARLPQLKGIKILLDCAYGAGGGFATPLFRALGAEIVAICDEKSGEKINVNCGALYPQRLINLSHSYDLAFAFDGDADRVLCVCDGKIFDGDKMMYGLAKDLKIKNRLTHNAVCGTVMTNLGLENAYKKSGIKLFRADVGDSAVYKLMTEKGLVLGGENSGHIIQTEFSKTGDGFLTAVMVAKLHMDYGINEYCDCDFIPTVKDEICVNETQMKLFSDKYNFCTDSFDGVRTVVRASGTEPKIRLLAESENIDKAKRVLESIKKEVGRIINDNK